jgi:hypothetical protein
MPYAHLPYAIGFGDKGAACSGTDWIQRQRICSAKLESNVDGWECVLWANIIFLRSFQRLATFH